MKPSASRTKIRVLTCIEHDRPVLLSHFIRHYLPKVDEIHVFVHVPYDGYPLDELRALGDSRTFLHTWPHAFNPGRLSGDREYYSRSCFSSGWVMPIDSDEFWDEDFERVVIENEKCGALWTSGWFVDRVASDGSLPEMKPDVPLLEQFPVRTELTRRVLGGYNIKLLMAKWPLWGFLHYLSSDPAENDKRHPQCFPLDHFKWDISVVPRMEQRFADLRRTNEGYQDEPAKFLEYWKKNGRIDVERYAF